LALLGLTAASVAASVGPDPSPAEIGTSFCTVGPSNFTCDLFEGGDSGTAETVSAIPVPGYFFDGPLVLLEDPNGGEDPANWSDILVPSIADPSGEIFVTFISDPDTLNFGGGNFTFVNEDPSGVTTVGDGLGNFFFIHSDADRAVPEPLSLALFGAGLIGLGAIRRFRPLRQSVQ